MEECSLRKLVESFFSRELNDVFEVIFVIFVPLQANREVSQSFFDQHPKINDFLDHSLRMWTVQRGTLTAAKYVSLFLTF